MGVFPLIPDPLTVAKWRSYRLQHHGTGPGSFFTINGLNPVVAAAAQFQVIPLFTKPPHGIIQSGNRGFQAELEEAFTGSAVVTMDSFDIGASAAAVVCNPLYDLTGDPVDVDPTHFATFNVGLIDRASDAAEVIAVTITVDAGDTIEDLADGGMVEIFVRWSLVQHEH